MASIDLTSVTSAKAWMPGLSSTTTMDDDLIQSCITAWSTAFLLFTGQGDQNNDNAQSPFTQVCQFNETYDGSGTYRLFLRNRPVQNVSSVTINGVAIAQSGAVGAAGYVIDGTGKSIALRQGITGWGSPGPTFYNYQSGPFSAMAPGLRFTLGIQNINVQYAAGYSQVPFDIQEAANIVVQQNYKRRSYQDEKSRSVAGGGGSIVYGDWALDPRVREVIARYSRTL
jgi:hypothetical protein